MYWEIVLKEILNKECLARASFIEKKKEVIVANNKRIPRKKYKLACLDKEVMLSKREAECLFFQAKGYTTKSIAFMLNLSPRTIEFYIKNLKQKMNCHSKFELISCVTDEFLEQVDFFNDLPIKPSQVSQ